MPEPETAKYHFGPLERRGLIGLLRPGQVCILVTAVVGFVGILSVVPTLAGAAAGLLVLVAAGLAGFVPVGGRTLDEWAGPWLRHQWREATGRNVEVGLAAGVGFQADALPFQPPADLAGIEILSVVHEGVRIGVAKDGRLGGYTMAFDTKGPTFMLRDRQEHDALVAGWGALLSALCVDGSPITRLQAIEETMPDGGHDLASYAERIRDPDLAPDSPIAQNYATLLASSAPASQRHRVLVVVRVDGPPAASVVREMGVARVGALVGGVAGAAGLAALSWPVAALALVGVGATAALWAARVGGAADRRDREACEALVGEVATLERGLEGCDVREVRPLGPRELAGEFRRLYDPDIDAEARAGDEAGVNPANLGPVSAVAGWSWAQTDSGLHRVWRVREFPRRPVHADWQHPLVLGTSVRRRLSYVFQPVPMIQALRRAEYDVTHDETAERASEAKGFRTTSRRRRQIESAQTREDELSAGHGLMRYAVYVSATVDADDHEALKAASKEITTAAARALCDVSPEYGAQARALTFTLPLARGL